MTTRFMLARHATCAQTEHVLLGRSVDAALDERGRRQAIALAQRVMSARPALVLTSPRRRARETAHAIVAHTGCPLQIAAVLDELDFGAWEGQAFAALAREPHWQRWNRERSRCRTPAGDSMLTAQARIVDYLHDLALAFAGATLALVTHAEPIRCALLRALGMPIDHWQRIDIEPASLTTLRMTAAGLRVDSINEPATREERPAA
jgi:broad specificity phosphatase PhoE